MKVVITRGLVVVGSLFVLGMLAISPRYNAFAQASGAAGGMGGCCGPQPQAPATDANGCSPSPNCGRGTVQNGCVCVVAHH